MNHNYKNTQRLTILTPVLLAVVVFLMRGGHGFYGPAIALFPTWLIGLPILHQIGFPFLIFAFLQYPVYGILIDSAVNKQKTILYIVAFHLALALTAFLLTREV